MRMTLEEILAAEGPKSALARRLAADLMELANSKKGISFVDAALLAAASGALKALATQLERGS